MYPSRPAFASYHHHGIMPQTLPHHRTLQPLPPPPPAVLAPRAAPSSEASSSSAPPTPPRVADQAGGRVKKGRTKASKKVRSSRSNVPGESRYWTPSEHKLFIEALLRFGPKNLKDIAAYVGTRNMIQCRTHEQKCFMRLLREAQKETAKRAGLTTAKAPKDLYSVGPNCGITLLCVVSEEMTRALSS